MQKELLFPIANIAFPLLDAPYHTHANHLLTYELPNPFQR